MVFSEACILVLQLAESSRQWGKERADLSLKLNEAEHGFARTGGMVLHQFPTLVSMSSQGYP